MGAGDGIHDPRMIVTCLRHRVNHSIRIRYRLRHVLVGDGGLRRENRSDAVQGWLIDF